MALQVGVVVVAGLYLGREVLIPITLAILLSFLLGPVVDLLRRLQFPRTLAVLVSVVLALGLALGVGGLIGTQVASLVKDIPRYATTVENKMAAAQGFAVGRLAFIMRSLDHQSERTSSSGTVPTSGEPAAEAATPGEQAAVPVEVRQPNPSPLVLAERILTPVLSPLATTGIVFVFSIFILLQQEDLRDRMIRLFGSSDLHRTTAALDDAAYRLSRYFLAQLGINTAFGCVLAAGLYVIGIPSPLLWGVLGGLLRFVPYVGAFLGAALPLMLAAAVDPGWSTLAWTAGLFVATESITGQVIEPLLYGHSTGLSPFSVVVAATFWTWLWGPIGLILSTPLTLCLVVMGRHVKRLEFLDVMLGDRPALTPIESFYQRMLADDPDEAQDQAELLLKERSLSSYYDEVALKGLQLAANDLQRGVLGTGQLERIKEAIKELVAELDHHDDRDPHPDVAKAEALAPSLAEQDLPKQTAPEGSAPPWEDMPAAWKADTAILCLAGRGPLDEAASTILAQLLRKHGLGARVIAYESASRSNIGSLDASEVAMVCVSYLEISGSPSHLRYLMRRLHERLPGRPILVGLWPSEDTVLKEERLRAVIGADHYTSSLKATVDTCLNEARSRAGQAQATTLSPAAGKN